MSEKQFDVVVVGSCNFDFINVVEKFPIVGETVKSRRFSKAFGGKGANQAVQCAKLGAKVAMVGKLGNDSFCQEYLENFDECGIDRSHVTTVDDCPTGSATVVVLEGTGENFIIVNSGANARLTIGDVDLCENMIKNSKIVVCQLEVPSSVARRTFEVAKKHKVLTLFNPAPADIAIDRNIFDLVDILCVNESEAQVFANIKPECPTSTKNCLKALRKINGRAIPYVLLTSGPKGCYFSSTDDVVHHVPTSKVTPVDTTGAGDSFVGALAFYLSNFPTLPMHEKVRRSCEIATHSVLSHGAQSSYASKEDLGPRLFIV